MSAGPLYSYMAAALACSESCTDAASAALL
jgi:hypothetical protein